MCYRALDCSKYRSLGCTRKCVKVTRFSGANACHCIANWVWTFHHSWLSRDPKKNSTAESLDQKKSLLYFSTVDDKAQMLVTDGPFTRDYNPQTAVPGSACSGGVSAVSSCVMVQLTSLLWHTCAYMSSRGSSVKCTAAQTADRKPGTQTLKCPDLIHWIHPHLSFIVNP